MSNNDTDIYDTPASIYSPQMVIIPSTAFIYFSLLESLEGLHIPRWPPLKHDTLQLHDLQPAGIGSAYPSFEIEMGVQRNGVPRWQAQSREASTVQKNQFNPKQRNQIVSDQVR